MRGLLYFGAGVVAATYAILRGQKVYRQYVPEPVRKEIAKRTEDAAIDLGQFSGTFRTAMAQREAELREELNLPED